MNCKRERERKDVADEDSVTGRRRKKSTRVNGSQERRKNRIEG